MNKWQYFLLPLIFFAKLQIFSETTHYIDARKAISDGYNGTPQGFENVCEDEDGNTKSYVLHAEANAITKVAQSSNSSKDATLYVTTSPCIECAKLIIQSGIKRVVFSELYRLTDGVELLQLAGIECVHLKETGNGEYIEKIL